jgi:tetratricopeptide (TPR) repeat protein
MTARGREEGMTMSRRLYFAALVVLLVLNTASGLSKIVFSLYRIRGDAALASANLESAFENYRSAVRWQPANSPSHVLIGRVLRLSQANGIPVRALGRPGLRETLGVGVGTVGRGIALSPADAWAWFNLAEVYRGFQLGRFRYERMRSAGQSIPTAPSPSPGEETVGPNLEPEDPIIIAATRQALKLEPVFFFYHDLLARLYWERGLHREAAREARASFVLMPLLSPHVLLDDDSLLQELFGPIVDGLDEAAAGSLIGPLVVARGYAEVYERLGSSDQALAAYEELLRLGGEAAEAECRYAMARIEQRDGRYRQSIPLLERVAEIDEDGRWGVAALGFLASAHSSLEEHGKAVEILRRYRAKRPDDFRPILLLADELQKAGDQEEAARLYLAAVRRFPSQPLAYQRLINCLQVQQRPAEALKYARRLQDLQPGDESTRALVRQLRAEVELRKPPRQ